MARGRKDLLSLSVEQFSESSLPLNKLHCPTTSSCSGWLLLSVMENSLERVLLSATDTGATVLLCTNDRAGLFD